MEAIRIGEHKMKLTLNSEETEKYGLCAVEECRDTAIVRRNIWNILDDAKKRSGFDPTGDKMLIQFYPMGDRGCEIFVTRLGILSDASARLVSVSDRITLISKRRVCYALAAEQALRQTARAIEACSGGVLPVSDLYCSENGSLYLVVEELGRGDGNPEFSPILEFARRLPVGAEAFVSEHFQLVEKGDALARYFNSADK